MTPSLMTTSLISRSEQELARRIVATPNALGDVADDETLFSQSEDLLLLCWREAPLPGLDAMIGEKAEQG